MTHHALRLIAPAAVLFLLSLMPAQAFNSESWVANNGNDANDCSLLRPCLTFQRAHDQTDAGGEIGFLTPGDYGPVTISRSLHITNDGSGEAGILVPANQHGILITAGNGDVISLRGLVIDGRGVGGFGINIQRSSAVHVQNCVIRNFESTTAGEGIGLVFNPGFPAGPPVNSQLFVSDTIIFNNGNGGRVASGGLVIQPRTPGNASAVLDRVHLENNVIGLLVDGADATATRIGAHVVLRDSVVSGNARDGIFASTFAGGAPAFIVIERTTSVNNAGAGILADGPGATILLSDSTVARNSTGITTVNSGQLFSYGNNRINNNVGPDGSPTGLLARN